MGGVIYKVTNRINGKVYVGKTEIGLDARWRQHRTNANRGLQHYLYRAMRKHGIDNFHLEILETVNGPGTLLSEREKFWIASLNATDSHFGYNCTVGGDGAKHGPSSRVWIKGRKRSPEAIARQAALLRGRKLSPERAIMCGVWRGKKVPADIVKRRVAAVVAAWTPEKRAEWGKKMASRWTPEARAQWSVKMSAQWGPDKRLQWSKPLTEEAKAKCRQASQDWWDKNPEAKERMKSRVISEETRQKCADAARRGWEKRRQQAAEGKEA